MQQLLANAEDLGRLLGGLSTRTIQRLDASGNLPMPVRVGETKRTMWVVREVDAWIAAGMPHRTVWENAKG